MSKIKVTAESCSLWGWREESVPGRLSQLLVASGHPWCSLVCRVTIPVCPCPHTALCYGYQPQVRPASIYHDLISSSPQSTMTYER